MPASRFPVHEFAKDIVHHNYASVVALTVAIWDCLTTLEDEVEYIWLSPWSKTKCTYLFARYYAVAYLITNIAVNLVWSLSIPISRSKCVGWYLHGMSSFCAQYIASHITLSRRILAAYEVRNMGSALLVFHVAELAGTLLSGKDTLSKATFDGVCNILSVPKDVHLFVGTLLLGQLLMWALILGVFRRRENRDSPNPNFREMVWRLWYDGEAKIAWVACCLALLFGAYRVTNNQKVRPVYGFAWPIVFLSIGTCRYILSMERNTTSRAWTTSPGSHGTRHEAHTCNERGGGESLAHVSSCHDPSEPLRSVHSSRLSIMPDSYPDSSSTDSLRWKHPSSSQISFDSDDNLIDSNVNSAPNDLSRRTSAISTGSSLTTLSDSSISSHTTQETGLTVPSVGTRSSVDIDIGSLHSSSSVTSEELREFWNDVWSGDAHTFART